MDTVLKKEPVIVLNSQKSADALQECISVALSPIAPPVTINGDGHRLITFGNAGVYAITVSIIYATPNKVEVRSAGPLNKKWRRKVAECAA